MWNYEGGLKTNLPNCQKKVQLSPEGIFPLYVKFGATELS